MLSQGRDTDICLLCPAKLRTSYLAPSVSKRPDLRSLDLLVTRANHFVSLRYDPSFCEPPRMTVNKTERDSYTVSVIQVTADSGGLFRFVS